MHKYIFSMLILACIIFSCNSGSPVQSGAQAALEEWFPQQYQVVDGVADENSEDNFDFVLVKSKNNPQLQFTLDYYPAKEKGGLSKAVIQSAIDLAKINAQPARELLQLLQKNGLKNAAIGTDLDKKTIQVQLYEEPFYASFGSRMRQIQGVCADWAAKRQIVPCQFTLRAMKPEAWGKRFPEIIDARLVNQPDAWINRYAIAEASADLADPGAFEFLLTSLRLSGDQESIIRKKAQAEVAEFLRTSRNETFHVELYAMVNSEWDLTRMDVIKYNFPYCKDAQAKQNNGNCMGNFDGRISCLYNLKTGTINVNY